MLDVNEVPGGYLSLPVNVATVVDQDHWLAFFFSVGATNAELDIFADEYRAAKLDSVCQVFLKIEAVMNLHITPDGRKRVGYTRPHTVQSNDKSR